VWWEDGGIAPGQFKKNIYFLKMPSMPCLSPAAHASHGVLTHAPAVPGRACRAATLGAI